MKILVTGGTGLIGKKLISKLNQNPNNKISILSRSKTNSYKFKQFYWNPKFNEIDEKSLIGIDCIIHLAGENIFNLWTKRRKKNIYDSRINSLDLIYNRLKKLKIKPKILISSSAIGWYGTISDDIERSENMPNFNDFLGNLCYDWESSADKFKNFNVKVYKVRTGIVLSSDSFMLRFLKLLSYFYLLSPISKGNQYFPWIHICDLVNIYNYILCNDIEPGPYNAVSPDNSTNKKFITELSNSVNRKIIMPNIPQFLINLLFGEMSKMLTNGLKISSKKIINKGFNFEFKNLKIAINDLNNN